MPPSDEDLDRLLASKLKHTSPEFELRWRELRRRFAHQPARRRFHVYRWLLWPGLATAGLTAAALVFVVRGYRRLPTVPDPAPFAELFALDAVLAPGTALLDGETRDAVLHLPAQTEL
jgi:hypothetical protein